MDLREQLAAYRPFNEQEQRDRELMLALLSEREDIFTRECTFAHMTVSGWVVNSERTRALMAFHNIYKSWSWLGGHADGERDLASVALREVKEESGIEARLVQEEPLSLEVLTVDGHVKRGKYVSSHLHLNVTYLLEADDKQPLAVKEDENSAVAWFALDEAPAASTEQWMRERIYEKLNAKLKTLRAQG